MTGHLATRLFLALAQLLAALVACGCSNPQSLALGAPTEEVLLSEQCPVRIEGFPLGNDHGNLSGVELVSSAVQAIELTTPQADGFFVVKSEDAMPEALYAAYWSPRVDARAYPLKWGAAGVVWRSISASGGPERDQVVINPGRYRLVLRYLSPTIRTSQRGRGLICIAISPPFEVSEQQMLLAFD